jgi:hypothetical protein
VKEKNETGKRCANPGCSGPIAEKSDFCDACELEWMLFRRDLRGSRPDGPERAAGDRPVESRGWL